MAIPCRSSAEDKIRMLLAVGMDGTGVVVATDSALVVSECEEISDRCSELEVKTPLPLTFHDS